MAPPVRMQSLRSAVAGSPRARAAVAGAAARLAERRVAQTGSGNRLQVGDGSLVRRLQLNIDGEDNLIVVGERVRLDRVTVTIRGRGSRIELGDDVRCSGPTDLWVEDEGSRLTIGAGSTFEPGCVLAALEGQALTIGDDCMFAGDTEIRTGDSHRIFDLASPDRPFNRGEPVRLGDHVWVGKRCFVLKGVDIADGVVVGAASIVTQTISEPRCVVAGNPARPVRSGVDWRR